MPRSSRIPPRDTLTVVLAAAAAGAGVLFAIAGGLTPYRPIEFCSLIVAAMLASGFTRPRLTAETRGTMPPAFVIHFASLLLFGTVPAVVVTSAGVVMNGRLAESQASTSARRTLFNVVTTVTAVAVAGVVHRLLGGSLGEFAWPAQGLPIAAAVVAYSFVKGAAAQAVAPLITKQPIDRAWPMSVLRESTIYFVGAGLAVAVVVLIQAEMWEVLPVAAVPLYFAYRAYDDYLARLEDEHRRREVIDSLDQGIAVLDSSCHVTMWGDALERIVGCTRGHALGRSLVSAVPALRQTPLLRAVDETLKSRTPRTIAVALPSTSGQRLLQVKLVPVAGGLTLLWHDITERTRAEQVLKRSAERLELAAEGANDGLWEWDLRTQEVYFSGRLRAMLGEDDGAGVGRIDEWLQRVHPDDIAGLNEALKPVLAGDARQFEHEHRLRHEDGTYRWFLSRGIAGGIGRRPARLAGSLSDTTERVVARERLRTAGFLDPLTGLRNRSDFVESLGRRLDEFKRRPGSGHFAVLYLDLDRFKVVNDSLGHLVGDELLVAVSRRLESCLRQGDCVGRLGGDEFAILLNTVADELQANAVAFRIQDALAAPLQVGGREVFTSVSIGIAVANAQYTSPDEIMRDADTAMYHAKAHGKARHELFDADMHARARDRLGLESDLRRAVNANDFEMYYQPIVLLGTGMCVGFESLIRWTRNGEKVSPAKFIPMAEELGLMEPLGTWVLQQACRTFADWQRRYPQAGLDYITVNASSRQLGQQNFLFEVEQAIEKSGLKPSALRIEVTETALMDSAYQAAELLGQLRELGVKIYLDDFGTGYSSLSHLHKLPVDALKIDRSFVTSLLLPERPAIVESILALARTMKTSVVAEGIESDVQARELVRLGCTHAQGYLFSRPLSTADAEALIAAHQPLGPQPTGDGAGDEYYASKPFEWPDDQPDDQADEPDESAAELHA